MTPDESETAGRTAVESWWTARRTRLAGLGGIGGGIVGLALLGLSAFSDGGFGATVASVAGGLGLLHPVVYGLFSVVLVASDARYGTEYGRRGRGVAASFALSLLSYAGLVVVLVVGRIAFGEVPLAVGPLVGAAYIAARLFGTLYGIVLWRSGSANLLVAGAFAALLPSMFVLGPLTVVGVPAVWIQSPLYLAFVALGYGLSTVGANAPESGGGVTG